MTNNEKRICVKLLRMAAEIYSEHGSNDLKLENTKENYDFAVDAIDNEYNPFVNKDGFILIAEYEFMDYLANLLESEIE